MVAVVVPCYRVKNQILDVLSAIGLEVDLIFVVDDCCPENSGQYVESQASDPRIKVIYHEKNLGVGGAVKTGYEAAAEAGACIMVKLDGDGQMNPELIPRFIKPLQEQRADYVKGNRFFDLDTLMKMPRLRLIGNSGLSLINKVVNGYWQTMDPTNGFTAIHVRALKVLPLDKIDNRYFFESDMLFRLGIGRAVVLDMPMSAHYADEQSSLKISRVLFEFPPKYFIRFWKRLFYLYFLRDFNTATIELVVGLPLILFGCGIGLYYWINSIVNNELTSSGTVMLAALPIIIGMQLLLSALTFDIQNIPKQPLSKQDFTD